MTLLLDTQCWLWMQVGPERFSKNVHALRVAHLPAHHRDPFDRLLTADSRLTLYDIDLLPAR